MHELEQQLQQGDFILGKAVGRFEEQYAAYSGTTYALGISNGLDALRVSLKALGIGKGHQVIVPANTFIATVLAVLEVGATPVLVDADPDTYNLDVAAIEAAITPQTRAIIPVHLYGRACDMPAIMQLADKHGLSVIEDNAQAQGAVVGGKKTGSWGHINATSFYPAKNLGALGDAGAITTNDAILARQAHLYRNVGSEKKYYHEVLGYNARMDTLQAAFLTHKLALLDAWNDERRQIARRYLRKLNNCPNIVLPQVDDFAAHVFHLFVVRSERRDELQNYLGQQGIQTLIHYPVPNHLQPALAHLGYGEGSFPITEQIAATCLSLPLFIGMKTEEIDYVAEKIHEFATLNG